MLDLENVNTLVLKQDLIKVTTFTLIARYLTLYNSTPKGDITINTLFEDQFIKSTIYTLIGFVIFWIFIEPYTVGSALKK